MASGHYYEQPRSFTSAELGFIKQLLDTFPVDKADELDIDDIHSHLYRNHPSIQENVQAAYPVILILIYSHCSFPFASQVPLTKDALIRSLGLLTTRSNNLFKPLRYKAEYSIQERTLTSKTEFLFSALAQPNPCTGVPKIDDILDIVSRVEYPHTLNPCMAPRRPLSHLYPTADRLLASSSDTELPSREILTVSTTVLEPLADLCKVIRDDDKVEGESLLAGKDSLTQEEFLQWATAVRKAYYELTQILN
jgi:hypothetical protein